MKNKARPIYVITQEIVDDMQREYIEARTKHSKTGKGKMPKHWKQKYVYFVEGYLNAMQSLTSIDDHFFMDDGRSIVAYALNNLTTWKGEKAREIKKELKAML